MVPAEPSTIGSELINPKEVIFPNMGMIAGLIGLIDKPGWTLSDLPAGPRHREG
jgi:hypothetical protein